MIPLLYCLMIIFTLFPPFFSRCFVKIRKLKYLASLKQVVLGKNTFFQNITHDFLLSSDNMNIIIMSLSVLEQH